MPISLDVSVPDGGPSVMTPLYVPHPVTVVVPDLLPYLFSIFGLLVLWRYYGRQVQAGRIQAVDLWDRCGVRFFIHVTPLDGQACAACRAVHGYAFLPTKPLGTPLKQPCAGCRCLAVGFYGAWPEAERLVQKLRSIKPAMLPLSKADIKIFLNGPWERSISASVDRLSIHMLEAMRLEPNDPAAAVVRYRFVVENAHGEHAKDFLLPAYLRLSALLESGGDLQEALDVVNGFEATYDVKHKGSPPPTDYQRCMMALRKSRLRAVLSGTGDEDTDEWQP